MGKSIFYDEKIKIVYLFTTIVMLMVIMNSILNMLTSDLVYSTDILKNAFLTNDFVNIVVFIPLFILVLILSAKKISKWELSLPGIMLFVIYNQIAYSISINSNIYKILNTIILLTSIYSFVLIITSIDQSNIKQDFHKTFLKPFLGIIISVLGILFIMRALFGLTNHFANVKLLTLPEIAVNISDLCICTVWLVAGILLLLKKSSAYYLITGVYFQSSLLFLCLILFLLLRPVFTNMSMVIADVIVIGIMSLVCVIPYILIMSKKEI